MEVEVQEATGADMYRIFEICSLGFARNEPFWDAVWPNHWTEAGRQQGAQRFTKIKNNTPETTYLKAIDASTGKIMGMAKWNIYDNNIPDFNKADGEKEDYWDTEVDKQYCEVISKEFMKTRNAAIVRTGGNVVSLDILAVDPEYQRKGVGHALVKWGTDKADALGNEAVVESSVFGKGLYLKHGFIFKKDVVLEPPEPFAGRDNVEFAWLERPNKA